MTKLQSLPLSGPVAGVRIRRIGEADLNWALAEGWRDFLAKRGDLLVVAILYPLIGLVTAAAALNDSVTPMFFPLVTGLSILGPAVASGFYELARRREAGLESSWFHFLDPLRGRSRTAFLTLTAALLVVFVAWQATAAAIYAATLGAQAPASIGAFITEVLTTPRGWTMIALGNIAGFGFAVLTLLLTVVSFPMAVDRPVDALSAMSTSVRAVAANPKVMASWGLRVVALLVLGSLPAFIGLAIVLPVLGYATWHLYTRLVER